MQLIKNNPYRILGLLIGATAAEQKRQLTRLQRFIEAEQEPDDNFSFQTLGKLHRTIDSVNDAALKLNLDGDKMNAALFWFYKGNDITDEPTFDSLKEADQQNAVEIWAKLTAIGEVTQRNCSAFQNLSTLLLCNAFNDLTINANLLEQGITLKLKFLESDYIEDFKALATDKTYKITKKGLQLLFLNQIQSEIDKNGGITSNKFLEILNKQDFSAKEDFLKGFVQKPIEQIKKKIEEAKTKRKANKANAVDVGKILYDQTSESLSQLKSILGTSSIKFSSISDKVSEEILQCGIDFFSHYRDSNTDPGSATMSLFQKAKSLTVGNIAKQRCQENTDNLQEWIDDKPEREIQQKVGKEIEFIIDLINLAATTLKDKGRYPIGYNDPYSDLPLFEQPHNKAYMESLETPWMLESTYFRIVKNKFNINLFRLARDIVKKGKSKLESVKNAVGASNEIYQKLSNDLASISLACLIEYVNKSGDSALGITPSIDEHVINAMNAIGELDMNWEMRKRYNEQKQSLHNLHKAVQKRSRSSGGGCFIATMAYGDYDHPQVMILRQFRDNVLNKSMLGKWFIKNYYHYSLKLVEKLKNKKALNSIIREILNQFINFIKK